MRPANLKTKIFVDSGDSDETKELLELLGFLDGQTTNPSLVSKNPEAKKRLDAGEKFSEDELLGFYKEIVQELSKLLPEGSISIEVYADSSTGSGQMLEQARRFNSWIPNAHIKFPSTTEGLKAAEQTVKEGIRVNMTLCFTQEQAAAVYAATKGAKKGSVFVSPFVGRLDDIGANGMDLIANIIKMYEKGDGHVEVLTASVRSMAHFIKAIELGSDIITAPFGILKEWASLNFPSPGEGRVAEGREGLKPIPYQELDLNKSWPEFDIQHPLTDKGMEKFSADWNSLII